MQQAPKMFLPETEEMKNWWNTMKQDPSVDALWSNTVSTLKALYVMLCHVCVFRVSRGITRCSHLLVPERIALCSCSWSLLSVQSLLLRRCFCLVQLRPSATVENKPKNSRFLFKRCFKIFQDFSYQQLACTRFFVLDWGSCPSWEYASALATEQWLKGMP